MFAMVEVNSSGIFGPRALVSLGTLRRLTLDLIDNEFDAEFYRIVQVNTGLQELNVTYQEYNFLSHIKHILSTRSNSFSLLRITFFERIENTKGRVAVQLVVGGQNSNFRSETIADRNQEQSLLQEFNFMHWNCDHIQWIRSDISALLLDASTLQHLSVLTSFTLDISCLSGTGLLAIQNVLSRSNLEHLHVLCSRFDDRFGSIAQLLGTTP